MASATDACGGIITISYSDVVTPGCGNSYTVVRTWEAEDACGNVSSCDQNITVRDITAPTISCPGDRTLDCPADTMPSNTGMASATDACGGIITISYSDVVTPGCGNSYTVVRTWEAEDACGNVSSCDQNITVRDITAPTISCPGDRTLDCPADTMPSNTGMASATDACGGIITISYSDVVTPGCGTTDRRGRDVPDRYILITTRYIATRIFCLPGSYNRITVPTTRCHYITVTDRDYAATRICCTRHARIARHRVRRTIQGPVAWTTDRRGRDVPDRYILITTRYIATLIFCLPGSYNRITVPTTRCHYITVTDRDYAATRICCTRHARIARHRIRRTIQGPVAWTTDRRGRDVPDRYILITTRYIATRIFCLPGSYNRITVPTTRCHYITVTDRDYAATRICCTRHARIARHRVRRTIQRPVAWTTDRRGRDVPDRYILITCHTVTTAIHSHPCTD